MGHLVISLDRNVSQSFVMFVIKQQTKCPTIFFTLKKFQAVSMKWVSIRVFFVVIHYSPQRKVKCSGSHVQIVSSNHLLLLDFVCTVLRRPFSSLPCFYG
mmetsp:Transcript_5711/g.8881  ORF Transcript_5711/g.8881 Transcript_5711/m.8881 type:complete len:100 (+) Transcript_5711:1188-1487(+)